MKVDRLSKEERKALLKELGYDKENIPPRKAIHPI